VVSAVGAYLDVDLTNPCPATFGARVSERRSPVPERSSGFPRRFRGVYKSKTGARATTAFVHAWKMPGYKPDADPTATGTRDGVPRTYLSSGALSATAGYFAPAVDSVVVDVGGGDGGGLLDADDAECDDEESLECDESERE
jgi:hypothetical protein